MAWKKTIFVLNNHEILIIIKGLLRYERYKNKNTWSNTTELKNKTAWTKTIFLLYNHKILKKILIVLSRYERYKK